MRPIQRRRELLSWGLWAIVLVALYCTMTCSSCTRVPPKAPELMSPSDRTLPVSVQMVPPNCDNTAQMLRLLALEIQGIEPRLASGDDLMDIIATAQYVSLLKLRDQTVHWRSVNVCEVL